jgi:hypothetical protein
MPLLVQLVHHTKGATKWALLQLLASEPCVCSLMCVFDLDTKPVPLKPVPSKTPASEPLCRQTFVACSCSMISTDKRVSICVSCAPAVEEDVSGFLDLMDGGEMMMDDDEEDE